MLGGPSVWTVAAALLTVLSQHPHNLATAADSDAFSTSPQHINATLGQTVVIQCQVKEAGQGKPVEWWNLNLHHIISSGTDVLLYGTYTIVRPLGSVSQWNLQLGPLTARDAGSYQCLYDGHRQTSTLTVTDAPVAPRPPPEQIPHVDYTACCDSRNISTSCRPACNPALLASVPGFDPMQDCGNPTDLKTLITCGADRRNHIPCCRRRSVPTLCLDWCLGRFPINIDEEQIYCMTDHTDNIVACFEEGQHLLPSEPLFVTANAASPTAVRVDWTAPAENGDSVTAYRVFYKQFDEKNYANQKEDTMTTSNLENLMPATKYSVYVVAVNAHGASLPSYTVVVTTPSDAPLPPTDTDAKSLMDCCVERGVNPFCQPFLCAGRHQPLTQEQMYGCLTELDKVFVCLAGEQDHSGCCRERGLPDTCVPLCGGHVVNTSLQNAYCTSYLPDINSCVQQNKGVLPGPPYNVRLEDVTMDSVTLSWEPPVTNSDKVKQYRVDLKRRLHPEVRQYMRKDAGITIPFLAAGAEYQVWVTSVGDTGTSAPSPAIIFLTYQPGGVLPGTTTTGAPRTQPPPHDIKECCRGSGVPSDCLVFCDYQLDVSSNPQSLLQKAFTCQQHLGHAFKCGAASRNATSCCQYRGLPDSCVQYCAYDDNDADNFHFNLDHVDCLARVADIQTCLEAGLDTIPSPPSGLTVTNTTQHAVSLMWQQPDYNHDLVDGYAVFYSVVGGDGEQMVRADDASVILQNLTPDSAVTVAVVAMGDRGDSLRSEAVTARTLAMPPTDGHVINVTVPTDLTACCNDKEVPSECIAACRSQTQLSLNTCGAQLGKLITCAADDRDHTACCGRSGVPPHCLGWCEGSPRVSDVTSLLCAVYTPQIMACFREGFDKLPSTPVAFHPANIVARSVTLAWQRPNKNGENAQYDLYYKRMDDTNYNVLEDVISPYELKHLEAFTHYNIYLVALNDYGASLPTPMFTVWTVAENLPVISIEQQPDEEYVKEGQKVVLICRATSSPPPTVYWLRSGVRTNGTELILPKIATSDTGRFTCIAGNDLGTQSKDIYLRVQYAPVATAVPARVELESGRGLTAELECHFKGFPETINWRKSGNGGSLIPPPHSNYEGNSRFSKSRFVQEDAGITVSKVTIFNARIEDYGTYSCEGNNRFGKHSAMVTLVDPASASSPGSAQPTPAPAQPDLPACCRSAGLSDVCLAACSWDVEVASVFAGHFDACIANLTSIVQCAADGRDHTKCCIGEAVPAGCLDYCVGVVEPNLLHLECVGYMTTITTCMQQGHGKIPSAPQNVKAKIEQGYISVWWSQPKANPDAVQQYIVYYSNGTYNNTMAVSYQVRRVSVPRIHSFSTYTIYVTARNSHGQSHPSNTVSVETYEMLPSSPRELQGTVVGGASVRLTWREPGDNPGAVLQYHVFYSIAGENKYKQVSVDATSGAAPQVVIHDLTLGATYNFHVSSKTRHYESDKSNVIAITIPGVEMTTAADSETSRLKGPRLDQVGVGVGVAVLMVAVIAGVGVAAYCYHRRHLKSRSSHSRFEESVSFENPGFAKTGGDGGGGVADRDQAAVLPADPVYIEPLPERPGHVGGGDMEAAAVTIGAKPHKLDLTEPGSVDLTFTEESLS